MNYPGNQGQSNGWPQEPPPEPPYSPGQRRSGASPHGRSPFDPPPDDETPFSPRPADSYGTTDPYEPRGGQEPGTYEPGTYEPGPYEPGPYERGGDADLPTRTYGAHAQPGEPGRHGPTPPRRRGPTPPGRRGNLPLIAGGAVLAGIVLIGGGIAVSNVLKDDPPPASAKSSVPPRAPTGPSASASPTRPIGGLGNSRTTDARPLTLAEIFRKRTFKIGTKRYTMTTRRADRNCARTVNGAKLVTALRRGSCSQVMRATFASADGRLIGTVGVANLRNATAARSATRVWNAKDAWVQPVPGPGITRKIGKGSALGTFQFKGHYLLMTWVQEPSGKNIPSSQHRAISKFGQDVMLGSGLFEALNYRRNVGKPLQK